MDAEFKQLLSVCLTTATTAITGSGNKRIDL